MTLRILQAQHAHACTHTLPNDVDVETLAGEVLRAPSIALHFPKWTDGRAYTQARLLRARLGYTGELRATGDVVVDMLPLLERTGFSTAVLRADQSRAIGVSVLGLISVHYQGEVPAAHGYAPA